MRSSSRWTPEEDAFLLDNYEKRGGSTCSAQLGRSRASVYNRAFRLGLKTQPSDWSAEEIELALKDTKNCLLNHRSMYAIYKARSRYG